MADLNLTPVHIKTKNKVGCVGSNPLWEILTTGGLYVNALGKGTGFEILGTGPHRAIARHITEVKMPNVQWTELNKGGWLPVEDYASFLPEWTAYTDQCRKANGDE